MVRFDRTLPNIESCTRSGGSDLFEDIAPQVCRFRGLKTVRVMF